MRVKQVIVIRKDLGMRRGKEIAQGSHASSMWLMKRMEAGFMPPRNFSGSELHCLVLSEAEKRWLGGEHRKVVCQVQDETTLRAIHQLGLEAGLESHLVTDLGATEFNGVPTVTACALGPDSAERIDPITGHLKLY